MNDLQRINDMMNIERDTAKNNSYREVSAISFFKGRFVSVLNEHQCQ
jgi:hypothetical protein